MFSVSGYRVPVFSLSIVFAAALSVVVLSCGEPQTQNQTTNTTPHIPERIDIGATGYTIQLLDGYIIQHDSVHGSFHFMPVNRDGKESEAGMYIGPRPDTTAPIMEYTKVTYPDVFLDDSVTWIEYNTANYRQREVFVEKTAQEKIHVWCYSRDPAQVEKLYTMVKSIR
jgi:hypothetical protein